MTGAMVEKKTEGTTGRRSEERYLETGGVARTYQHGVDIFLVFLLEEDKDVG